MILPVLESPSTEEVSYTPLEESNKIEAIADSRNDLPDPDDEEDEEDDFGDTYGDLDDGHNDLSTPDSDSGVDNLE